MNSYIKTCGPQALFCFLPFYPEFTGNQNNALEISCKFLPKVKYMSMQQKIPTDHGRQKGYDLCRDWFILFQINSWRIPRLFKWQCIACIELCNMQPYSSAYNLLLYYFIFISIKNYKWIKIYFEKNNMFFCGNAILKLPT